MVALWPAGAIRTYTSVNGREKKKGSKGHGNYTHFQRSSAPQCRSAPHGGPPPPLCSVPSARQLPTTRRRYSPWWRSPGGPTPRQWWRDPGVCDHHGRHSGSPAWLPRVGHQLCWRQRCSRGSMGGKWTSCPQRRRELVVSRELRSCGGSTKVSDGLAGSRMVGVVGVVGERGRWWWSVL